MEPGTEKVVVKAVGVMLMLPDAVIVGVDVEEPGAVIVTVPLLAVALYPLTAQLPVLLLVQALMFAAM